MLLVQLVSSMQNLADVEMQISLASMRFPGAQPSTFSCREFRIACKLSWLSITQQLVQFNCHLSVSTVRTVGLSIVFVTGRVRVCVPVLIGMGVGRMHGTAYVNAWPGHQTTEYLLVQSAFDVYWMTFCSRIQNSHALPCTLATSLLHCEN